MPHAPNDPGSTFHFEVTSRLLATALLRLQRRTHLLLPATLANPDPLTSRENPSSDDLIFSRTDGSVVTPDNGTDEV